MASFSKLRFLGHIYKADYAQERMIEAPLAVQHLVLYKQNSCLQLWFFSLLLLTIPSSSSLNLPKKIQYKTQHLYPADTVRQSFPSTVVYTSLFHFAFLSLSVVRHNKSQLGFPRICFQKPINNEATFFSSPTGKAVKLELLWKKLLLC